MKRTFLAASLAVIGTAAFAEPGYVTDSSGHQVTGAFGQCVRSGTWTPAQAKEPCDPVPNAAPVVSAAPQPVEEPLAEQAPEPAPVPPVLEKVTLSTDVLFEFGSATLKEAGKQNLDELAGRLKDANVEQVVAVGHADRIGSEEYNQKLSEERAQSVTAYLQGNIDTQNLQAEGRGKAEPVTGDDCKGMKKSRQLIDCMQPDRRVEIEVFGTRETEGPGSAGIGSSTPPDTTTGR